MPPTAVALGFTLWQLEYSPRAQYQQVPQKMLNGTITGPRPAGSARTTHLVDHADELVPKV
jgi:hypothetical protein